MFFQDSNNLTVFRNFLQKGYDFDDEVMKGRFSDLKQIVSFMSSNPVEWDTRCKFNIKFVGNSFLSGLISFDPTKKDNVVELYTLAYRFLCEFDLFIGFDSELSIELRRIKGRIEQDSFDDNSNASHQIRYATYLMPVSILREMLNSVEVTSFVQFKEQASQASKLKEQWDAELTEKGKEVDSLKQKLEEYSEGFNFVGLYKGFSELGEQKKKELKNLFRVLSLMGIAVLLPLVAEIVFLGQRLAEGMKFEASQFLGLLPVFTLVLILIYFFRVILHNYNSVRAQVIQIELRQTLCQFIQNYVDYAAKMKKQDAVALEKFENLIFSGILADTDKLPSTFDGIEQLAGLIKTVKGDK